MGLELLHIVTAVTAVSLVPWTPALHDDVDLIELNHVYNSEGQHVLSQLIFWEHNDRSATEHVIAWRLWKPGTSLL